MAPKKTLEDYAKEFYVGGGDIALTYTADYYKIAAKTLTKVQPQVKTRVAYVPPPDTRYCPPNPPSTVPTTVYRVENGQCQGPYSRQARHTIALEDALANQCSIRCPEPSFDGLLEYKENPLCKSLEIAWSRGRYGFLDMDCLRRWFTPEEWRLLYESGYRIVAYATTDIQWLGRSGQLAFNPGASRPLDTYPIDYYDTPSKAELAEALAKVTR